MSQFFNSVRSSGGASVTTVRATDQAQSANANGDYLFSVTIPAGVLLTSGGCIITAQVNGTLVFGGTPTLDTWLDIFSGAFVSSAANSAGPFLETYGPVTAALGYSHAATFFVYPGVGQVLVSMTGWVSQGVAEVQQVVQAPPAAIVVNPAAALTVRYAVRTNGADTPVAGGVTWTPAGTVVTSIGTA